MCLVKGTGKQAFVRQWYGVCAVGEYSTVFRSGPRLWVNLCCCAVGFTTASRLFLFFTCLGGTGWPEQVGVALPLPLVGDGPMMIKPQQIRVFILRAGLFTSAGQNDDFCLPLLEAQGDFSLILTVKTYWNWRQNPQRVRTPPPMTELRWSFSLLHVSTLNLQQFVGTASH